MVKDKTNLRKRNIFLLDEDVPFELETKPELVPAYKVLEALNVKQKTIYKHFNTFKGVAHRIEWLGSNNNIFFVNDSAATIPAAVEFSISHFENINVHLICGGTDKKLSTKYMLNTLKKAKSLTILDGTFTQNSLLPLLEENKMEFKGPFKKMRDAFDSALSSAKEDSALNMKIVLLSPGAASFDFFINEFDRGEQFKKLAKNYINKESS